MNNGEIERWPRGDLRSNQGTTSITENQKAAGGALRIHNQGSEKGNRESKVSQGVHGVTSRFDHGKKVPRGQKGSWRGRNQEAKLLSAARRVVVAMALFPKKRLSAGHGKNTKGGEGGSRGQTSTTESPT